MEIELLKKLYKEEVESNSVRNKQFVALINSLIKEIEQLKNGRLGS
jgi:hypothetical protein